MKRTSKRNSEKENGANWMSFLLLMLALCLLIVSCKSCYPAFGARVESLLQGTKDKVSAAFSEMTLKLGSGEDVVSAFRQTRDLLTKHD